MKQRFFSFIISGCVMFGLLSSCKKEMSNTIQPDSLSEAKASQEQKSNTFYGPQISFGGGKVRSFFTVTHTGVPLELGVQITADAFSGLTTEPGEYSYIIPLHQKAQASTPFDHIEVDWNPFGHPPPGIYNVPHFDFHFYKISVDAQMAIPPYTNQTAGLFDAPPPPGYLPSGYIPGPGGVPQMGKHWLDITSPEFIRLSSMASHLPKHLFTALTMEQLRFMNPWLRKHTLKLLKAAVQLSGSRNIFHQPILITQPAIMCTPMPKQVTIISALAGLYGNS